MSKAEDIHTLFRRFGGDASTYQEIVASEQAQSASGKWPMLAQIKPAQHHEAPAAARALPGIPARQFQSLEDVVVRTTPVAPPSVPAQVTVLPVSSEPAPAPTPECVVHVTERAQSSMLISAPTDADLTLAGSPDSASRDSSLRAMFDRMVPVTQSASVQPASPLKRLVKW